MTEPLKTIEDFDDPLLYEAYLLTLFATRLNPKINKGFAYECSVGYLHMLYSSEEDPGAERIIDLADELIEGPTVSGSTH